MRHLLLGALALLVATPAFAEEREYCPERPGLGTPACTVAPGRVSIETALGDWSLQNDPDSRTDTFLIGDTKLRVGLTDSIEAQIDWTPLGVVRARDKASGAVDTATRTGDVELAVKANLLHPDGKGLSIAVLPFVTVPVGRAPVGAGDWGAGLVLPVTYDVSDAINLEVTPEIDAAVNEDGRGRHFAASATIGLALALTRKLTGTAEVQLLRDEDPAGKSTQALGALSLAWMVRDDLQLDIGGIAGLDHDAPDAEIYFGIARRI
ncbi:transporter [Sphingomonas immobilis]|uniref:Transporter n=1 Tax=Sphingomonas immobilis TaxID=3063997 RepID=A0ABT8ZXX4_9SPHN|nr:transporter [Sphingomonas sp. CA1-15]MDO7841984.1 transporter [Sphingomonas sp. CA1-15]